MEKIDWSKPVSRLQILFKCDDAMAILSPLVRAGDSDPTVDKTYPDLFRKWIGYIEFLVERLSSKKGTASDWLIHQRDYRICAAAWLDSIVDYFENCFDKETPRSNVNAIMHMGPLVAIEPLYIMLEFGEELARLGAYGDTAIRQLELQASREQTRRKAVIELLASAYGDAYKSFQDDSCVVGLMRRTLSESLAVLGVRGDHVEEDMRLASVSFASAADKRIQQVLRRLVDAWRDLVSLKHTRQETCDAREKFFSDVRDAASVRVHKLDAGLRAQLRAQSSLVQLKMHGFGSRCRSFMARHGAVVSTHADELGPAASPAGTASVAGPAAEAVPEPESGGGGGLKPSPLHSVGSAEDVPGVATVRPHPATKLVDSAGGTTRGENAKGKSRVVRRQAEKKKGAKKLVGKPRGPAGARGARPVQRFSLAWGNAENGLWDWVREGVAQRFGRATLERIVLTQFEKVGPATDVPGRFGSPDVPNWVEGTVGHHTLPRSNLALFFVRNGDRVKVVGVGGHGYDRKRPNKDYNVFWWREEKGKAVGPKRPSLRS